MTFHPRDLTEQFLVEAWYIYQTVRFAYPLLPVQIEAHVDDRYVAVRLVVFVTQEHAIICEYEARQYRRSARYNVRLHWEPTTFEEMALAPRRTADWPAMSLEEEVNLADISTRFRDAMIAALERACGPPTRKLPDRSEWTKGWL